MIEKDLDDSGCRKGDYFLGSGSNKIVIGTKCSDYPIQLTSPYTQNIMHNPAPWQPDFKDVRLYVWKSWARRVIMLGVALFDIYPCLFEHVAL